jgi:general secretion pathway protein H
VGSLTRGGSGRTSAGHRGAGFTLVEIVVVLAILAIVAGAATLVLRGPESSTRREAERFGGALAYAAQRAQWRQERLGVGVDAAGWRFWRQDPARDGWSPLVDDDALAARRLPDGVAITARSLAGAALPAEAIVPLRANGRNDPATFELEGGGARWRVATDPLNRVSVEPAS